ncbi:MBL fold metallo-hydrolase [Erwinia sp. AnSW2-5]|uniref:MBL fold metallo-hydrolase n=1 Tax=Erwinia sp. AnSW2-5 TaxID=3367692 RepID=UPI0038580243
MKITQVRNATQLIVYAGKTFLIDPMLSKKDAWPGFEGTARSEIRNPMVELPFEMALLLDVDAIIVTHTHQDHWDEAAVALIQKEKLIFVQNNSDEQLLRSQGFSNLVVLSETSEFGDISLIKTRCQHGSDAAYAHPQLAERLGDSSGIVFQHPAEKSLYLVGDSIWIDAVEENMRKYRPGVVIMNTGWAHILGYGPIIFGKDDLLKAHRVLPEAQIVATHMEAVNHCLVTRHALLEYARDNHLQDFVSAPADGASVTF